MSRFDVSCGCGYTSTTDTQARAEYALRKHVCQKHLDAAATRARGEAKRAAVDKSPKPCLHKQASHQHGTYVCYVADECRCPACTAANTDYERTRFRQHVYGRWNGLIDAQPAREHVEALMASGMGLKRIAVAAGVSAGAVGKLIYGAPGRGMAPSTRLQPGTVTALLAVEFDCAYVPAVGTRRRLEALTALGWSRSELARRLGTTDHQIAARGGQVVLRSHPRRRPVPAMSMTTTGSWQTRTGDARSAAQTSRVDRHQTPRSTSITTTRRVSTGVCSVGPATRRSACSVRTLRDSLPLWRTCVAGGPPAPRSPRRTSHDRAS